MNLPPAHACLAVATPGLESLVSAELEALGLAPGPAERGGVPFEAPDSGIRRANLWLRTASRVLVRLGSFRARTFAELERHAARVDWGRVTGPAGVTFDVTSRKSRLYHQGAIAERLARAAGPAHDGQVATRVVVRVVRDTFTLSADSSGEHLHRRGWRTDVARAPLRETLASAMVRASAGRPGEALVDPLCGSGTIVIEAALQALGVAPGLGRHFAFEDWPAHDAGAWEATRQAAAADRRNEVEVPILGSDRDAGAIDAAQANADRAGVGDAVEFTVAALSAAPALRRGLPAALVLTNPPYGKRVGDPGPLRDLYAALGAVVRGRPGWRAAWLDADPRLAAATGLEARELFRTTNGGIPVRLLEGSPSGP